MGDFEPASHDRNGIIDKIQLMTVMTDTVMTVSLRNKEKG